MEWDFHCNIEKLKQNALLLGFYDGKVGIGKNGEGLLGFQAPSPVSGLIRLVGADMIFVKKFTRPQFWEQEFYAKNA